MDTKCKCRNWFTTRTMKTAGVEYCIELRDAKECCDRGRGVAPFVLIDVDGTEVKIEGRETVGLFFKSMSEVMDGWYK